MSMLECFLYLHSEFNEGLYTTKDEYNKWFDGKGTWSCGVKEQILYFKPRNLNYE